MSVVEVSAGIIKRNNSIFLTFRDQKKHQGGLWEFPGGKREEEETPYDALCRELKEECAIDISSAELFRKVSHDYADKKVVLYFYIVENFSGEPRGAESQKSGWFDICSLVDLAFPEANKVIVDELISRFG